MTEHHLGFLSLKGSCTGSFESTLIKMPNGWNSHVTAQPGIRSGPFSRLFAYWVIMHASLSSADFFQNQLLRKLFQEKHQSVKRFRSRSGLTFCQA